MSKIVSLSIRLNMDVKGTDRLIRIVYVTILYRTYDDFAVRKPLQKQKAEHA